MCGQNYRITGGSDRVMFDEIEMLSLDGEYNVAPFCAKHEKNINTKWSEYFVDAADFDNPGPSDVINYIYNRDAVKKFKMLYEHFNPDIIHFHIFYGKITSSILPTIKKLGLPVVQTLHEYKSVCPVYTMHRDGMNCSKCRNFNYFNVVLNKCNRGSLARSVLSYIESSVSRHLGSIDYVDKFIAVSDFMRMKVVEMGVPANKVVTIHNPIDTSHVIPVFEVGDYYLYFGRLEKSKGIWPLIEAFEILSNEKLLIIGDGAESSNIDNYIEKKRLKNISRRGFMVKSDLAKFISGCRATIMPSIWAETFGLTAGESLAYGKPVIASNIGGIPEVVSDANDSFLIEPGNVLDLVDKIKIMSNNSLVKKMGVTGRSNIEIKFSKAEHLNKLKSVYNLF